MINHFSHKLFYTSTSIQKQTRFPSNVNLSFYPPCTQKHLISEFVHPRSVTITQWILQSSSNEFFHHKVTQQILPFYPAHTGIYHPTSNFCSTITQQILPFYPAHIYHLTSKFVLPPSSIMQRSLPSSLTHSQWIISNSLTYRQTIIHNP